MIYGKDNVFDVERLIDLLQVRPRPANVDEPLMVHSFCMQHQVISYASLAAKHDRLLVGMQQGLAPCHERRSRRSHQHPFRVVV
jgi:hypothetical protein